VIKNDKLASNEGSPQGSFMNELLSHISVLEQQKRSLELAVHIAKQALETCRDRADSNNDNVSFKAASEALTGISEAHQEDTVSGFKQPTYLTTDQARDWAWKETRRAVDDSNWNVGESSTFLSFFLHGWNNRGQYELQRRDAVADMLQQKTIT